jgi:serine/threonine protein kinase
LNHASIVPIHEIGEHDGYCYFSMNLLEGGQLDEVVRQGKLPIRRAVELLARLARGVHYAHEHGILHRDIKPGNILLDAEGEAHLTDFGLARWLETDSNVTRTTEVLGTPSYIAPEQARGTNSEFTSATDVYGLGAVLYHLLTGNPPFVGATTFETIRLVLETEPRRPRLLNPKVDPDLSTICLKCLEKDPGRRYPSALALADDLERWLRDEPIQARPVGFFVQWKKCVQRNPAIAVAAGSLAAFLATVGILLWKDKLVHPPPTNTGIAVLPFENLSGDKSNAYFVDGIQDEILTSLTRIRGLKVISRISTARYNSRADNVSEIASQLGVANLVEGSVQKASDRAHINVKLINALNGTQLWAQSYDRDLKTIFAVENEVAQEIAFALKLNFSKSAAAARLKQSEDPQAYDLFCRLTMPGRNRCAVTVASRSPFGCTAPPSRAIRNLPSLMPGSRWSSLFRSTLHAIQTLRETHACARTRRSRCNPSYQRLTVPWGWSICISTAITRKRWPTLRGRERRIPDRSPI